jgi:hypothetical protein
MDRDFHYPPSTWPEERIAKAAGEGQVPLARLAARGESPEFHFVT